LKPSETSQTERTKNIGLQLIDPATKKGRRVRGGEAKAMEMLNDIVPGAETNGRRRYNMRGTSVKRASQMGVADKKCGPEESSSPVPDHAPSGV
jgi:hypothetical protein